MGKAVQHPFRLRFFTQVLYSQPVVFLIQEKAGFLSILYIHQIADPVFQNFHLGIKGFTDKALIALHPLLQTYLGVAALVDTPNMDILLFEYLKQLFQDYRL